MANVSSNQPASQFKKRIFKNTRAENIFCNSFSGWFLRAKKSVNKVDTLQPDC
jgi:hypothetical protein